MRSQRSSRQPTPSLRNAFDVRLASAGRMARGGSAIGQEQFEHLFEADFDQIAESLLHFLDVAKLGEGPSAVSVEPVHAGDPIVLHRHFLVFCVLSAVALDLDDQLEKAVGAAPGVHQQDEIGNVDQGFGTRSLRDLQPCSLTSCDFTSRLSPVQGRFGESASPRGRQGPGRNDSDEEVAVCISVRRVPLSFSSTCSWKESFALANLRAAPAAPT